MCCSYCGGLPGYATYGYVLPGTLAWREGRSEWLPVSELEELASVAAAAQAYLTAASQPDNAVGTVPAGVGPEVVGVEAGGGWIGTWRVLHDGCRDSTA